MYKITLADGTVLDGLTLNGNNFISDEPIKSGVFLGKLSRVRIERIGDAAEGDDLLGEELIGTHENMKLAANRVIGGKQWFILADMTADELWRAEVEDTMCAAEIDTADWRAEIEAALCELEEKEVAE